MAIYKEDSFLKYDKDFHRYYLNPQYMSSFYGIDVNTLDITKEDLSPNTAGERFLKRISFILYDYIYEYVDDVEIMEYLLAGGEPKFRNYLVRAMGEFAYAIYLSGNDYSLEFGLTLDNGKELDRRDLSIQMVPQSVKNILETGDILWRGKRSGYDVEEIRNLKEKGEF